MGSFSDTLRNLLAKITGTPSSQSKQSVTVEDLRPTKHDLNEQKTDHKTQALQNVTNQDSTHPCVKNMDSCDLGKVASSKSTAREPYFFQIGFDFGTSSSKAIIRDINADRAWVYANPAAPSHCAYIIPSSVIYKDGYLERHLDAETLYPEGGLYHLKMAAENVAKGIMNAPILAEYKRIVKSAPTCKPADLTKLACIYFLSSAFSEIVASILQKFPAYGQTEGDQIAINMAIPASDISENKIHLFFDSILHTSWELSCQAKSDIKKISVSELAKKAEECERRIKERGKNELCHVYPEVSANMQAFIRSPASSPDNTSIYFFSDTGAGTVDQCVFTYAGVDQKRINYFSAGVYPRGSSQIEITVCGDTVDEKKLEYWRKEKERDQDSPPLSQAKGKVGKELEADTLRTIEGILTCLPSGEGGIFPENTLKEKIKFVFSGGGHTKYPYQSAVVDAYKSFLRLGRDPIITSMAHPPDLDIPKGCEQWLNRLYVAYGLSFLFHDLAENTFPQDNKIDPVEVVTTRHQCSCEGRNKSCFRCYGSGIVQ